MYAAESEACSSKWETLNLCCYYICSFVYTDVKNNFHMCKNSSALSINAALWHYLGTYNLDFRHENNSTPGVLIEEIRYATLKLSFEKFKPTIFLKCDTSI